MTGERKAFISSTPKEETRKPVRKLTRKKLIQPMRKRPIKKTRKAVMRQPRYFRMARRVFMVWYCSMRGMEGEGEKMRVDNQSTSVPRK